MNGGITKYGSIRFQIRLEQTILCISQSYLNENCSVITSYITCNYTECCPCKSSILTRVRVVIPVKLDL